MGLRLLILCLSLATFGVNDAWGGCTYDISLSPTSYSQKGTFPSSINIASGDNPYGVSAFILKVSFDAGAKTITVKPQYSLDNSTWTDLAAEKEIKTSAISSNSVEFSANNLSIPASNKIYLRIAVTSSKNYSSTRKLSFSNFSFTKAITLTPAVSSITIAKTKIDGSNSNTFKVGYSNMESKTLTVTSDQSCFIPSTNIGLDCSGEKTITVTYNPTCDNHATSATLTLSANNITKTVTASASWSLNDGQEVNWRTLIDAEKKMRKGTTLDIAGYASAKYGSNDGGGTVYYTSSNSGVISVGVDGHTLTAVSKGTAKITAHVGDGCKYSGASSSEIEFTVSDKATPKFIPNWIDSNLKVGDKVTLTVENVSNEGPIVVETPGTEEFCAIEDPKNSVTITRSGNTLSFTPVRDGTLTVTLVQVETETVTGASETYTFNVSKHQTSLSVSPTSCTLDVDATQNVTVTTNNSDVTVGVTSSNPDVAVWDATNNRIMAKAVGSAIITFKQEASEKWTEATATVAVTVELVDNTLTVPSAKTMTVNDTWSNVLSDKNSNAELVVSNTNSDVATYDATSNTITAKKAGTATFTFSQAATAKYAATTQSVTVTVNKKSNAISVTLNGVATTSAQMYYSSGITAVVTSNNTDKPILYEQTEGSTIATYYQDQNAIYSLSAAGTAKWRFWQEADDVYSAATKVVVTVDILKPAHNVPFTYNSELYNDNGFTIKKEGTTSYEDNKLVLGSYGLPGGWDDKYVDILFEGMPDTLTFSFETAGLLSQTQVEWYVQEGTSQATLSNKPFTATSSSGDAKVGLQASTRCIRVCYSGNYSGRITNLKVTEKHYLEEADPETSQNKPWDFGEEALGADDDTKSFNVNWANIAPVTVTSSDPTHFSVTPSGFAQYGELGSQSINVTYHRSKDIAEHSATITITNGTYTQYIYVKGETTKKSLTFEWNNALSSTGYVMNVGEKYPSADITYIAKLALEDENAKVTFSSSNSSAIEVSEDGKTIHAIGAGTSEITANYPGSDQYNETSSTKTFTVDNKLKQTITWNQNLMGLKWGDDPLTLSATASSGGTITYSIKEGSTNCVTLSGTNNATLNISTTVAGEAYIIASQAGGEIGDQDYFPITMMKRVIVRDPESPCEEYALAGQSCTFANNLNNPKEFDLSGTPATLLTFKAYHDKYTGSWSTLHTYGALLIDEYAYINEQWQWVNIFNEVVNQGSYKDYYASVDASATKIRVRSSEEVDHHVSDLSIKRAKYMTSSVESLTGAIDINTLYSKDIKIDHSNIDVMTVTVNGDFNESNLSTSTLGDGCGSYGEDAFTFSFTPTQAKTYKGTITISDGKEDETKIEISIELTAQAIAQTIIDFTSEAETHWTTDNVTFNGRVLPGYPVYYTSSDETVATIDGNKLNILKSGTVTITAHCDAVGAYAAAPEIAKVITINKAIPTITANPTADVCYRPCTLKDVALTGGTASVDGVFQWMNTSEEVKVGTNNYNAKFTPNDQVKYAVVENIVIPVTPSFKDQTITWNPAATYYGCETIAADATTSSDLAVTYSSNNSGVISAEQVTNGGWAITIKSPGTATITVSQAGNETYSAAPSVSKTITINKCEPVTIEGTITASDILVGTALSTSTLNTTNAKAYFSYNDKKVEVAGSFAWQNPSEILDAYGTYQRTVKFTPTNTALYGEATKEVSVTATVHLIKFVEPLPEYNVNAGQKLRTATLVSGYSELQARSVGDAVIKADQPVEAESIEWENGDEVINTAEAVITRTMIFNPKKSHFSPKNAQITVHVIKQTPNVIWAGDEVTLTAGQTLNADAATYLSSCTANVAGTFTWENGTNQVLYSQNGSKVKVIFTPNDVAYYTVTKEVTLHVNKATRTIEWNQPELASVAVNADPITLTASISGPTITGVTDQIQYTSSDGTKASIVNGQLVAHCATATPITITASVPENENFETTQSKQVQVSITSITPTLHPTATAILYGQSLASSSLTLTGGDTEGTIAWKNATVVPSAVGTYNGTAVFTPEDECTYTSCEVPVSVTVIQAQPTITWTGQASYPASATGDVDLQLFKITPEALQSSLSFSTSDAAVASIVNGKIHCNKQGTVTITATYAGNANYKSANKEQQITFVGIADEITWNEGKELRFYAKDQIPSNVAVAKSGLAVTYESKDETIVKVENGTKLSAISAGTVNIIARTQGDSYTAPCVSEVTFTIDRRPQTIVWNQSFVNYVTTQEGTIDVYSDPFNAVAMDGLLENIPSGSTISYSVPTGQSVAEIKDGKLHLIGEGETTITASVSQTGEYEAFTLEKMVKVRKFGENCESFVLEELKEKAIGSGFEYSYDKPGAKLSFKARKSVLALDGTVNVYGKASENDDWTQIMTFNLNHTSSEPYDHDINENYRMIRFITEEDLGNNSRYISDVSITQASYLRTESATIDEKVSINQDYVKEIKVYFSDIPPIIASITNETGANLTLKPIRVSLNGAAEQACTEASNDCGDYGYYVYQLRGSWEDPHKYTEQITFTTSLGEMVTVGVDLDVDMLGQMTFDNHNETARWSDPKNWYYGGHEHGKLPTASHSVEIDQNVIVDCEANVYNLKIYAHDGVYPEVRIAPQGGLTIHNGGITVGDKCSVVIESSKENQGYLRVSPKWANGQGERYSLPTATVQLATRGDIEAAQKVDGKQDAQWQYMGFPVEAMGYNVDYITWLYEWNEAQGWIDKKAESDASPKKQAEVAPFTAYALTQYGTPVLEYNGKLINRDVTIPFTYTPGGLGGQNMFANSYPSPIDVKCFTQDDVPSDAGAMDFTFYLYNTGTWADWYDHGTTKERAAATPGTFTAIPMLSASYLDNYQTLIPSMQGVCVQVYQAETFVKLNYQKHVWYAYERTNTVDDMNQPQRVALHDNTLPIADVTEDMRVRDSIRQAHENQVKALTHRAQIIVNSENSGSTSVYLLEKADFTKGYDNGYDAPLMGTFGVVNLYTTEEDGLMAVSASNDLDGTFVGFLSGEDTNYELSISSVIGDSLQLMDVQTGDVFDVKDGATYSFMATPNYEDDYRFRIIKAENTPVVPTGWTGLSYKAKIWYNKQVLYITDADANSVAFIYSAAGELLKQVTFNHNTTISTTDLPEGVYTVRVEDSVLKFFVKH